MRNLAKFELIEVSGGDEQMGPPAPLPPVPPCTTTNTTTTPTVSVQVTMGSSGASVTVGYTSGSSSTGTTCPTGPGGRLQNPEEPLDLLRRYFYAVFIALPVVI
jgi:hypothetical protein